jgi:hypothetical protein
MAYNSYNSGVRTLGSVCISQPYLFLPCTSAVNFKLGKRSLPATFHTTRDGASTAMSSLKNVAGEGPKRCVELLYIGAQIIVGNREDNTFSKGKGRGRIHVFNMAVEEASQIGCAGS